MEPPAHVARLVCCACLIVSPTGVAGQTAQRPHDVAGAFAQIPRRGEAIIAESGDSITGSDYTAAIGNRLGFRNHFQSVLRLAGTNWLVVSGSDEGTRLSSLFLVTIGTRSGSPWLGGNAGPAGRPSSADSVVARIPLDEELWHAGGLAATGALVAVPVYGGDPRRGRVLFYDLTVPEAPRQLATSIERPRRKAYAVGMTELVTGGYLAVVLSDRDGLPRRLDFYRSRGTDLAAGFEPEPATWFADQVRAVRDHDANFGDFQNLALVQQADGELFLVGMHNTAPSMEILPGRDYADLYVLDFPGALMIGESPEVPTVTKIANRHLICEAGNCNLDAASSLYVAPDGEFAIYAGAFWLDDGRLKLTEFAQR